VLGETADVEELSDTSSRNWGRAVVL
jgi:hypothetical protein